MDEMEEAKEVDPEQCYPIPHKNALNLGTSLVFEFVGEHLPEDYERVRQLFKRKGAYARYKSLLERRGLLKKWHETEEGRVQLALRQWCRDRDIDLEG